MKNLIKTILAVSVLCLAGCKDDPDVGPIKRDTDVVTLAYKTDASSKFSVRYNGSWEAVATCLGEDGTAVDNWFSISPDKGVGNGDYQWITVTAQRNPGDKRSGKIYLSPRNASSDEALEITVEQESGFFTIPKPTVTGSVKMNRESAAALVVPYDKAFGGEKVEIVTTASGVAGLEVKSPFTGMIELEGSGEFEIPIMGTAEAMGTLELALVVKVDGKVVFEDKVTVSVGSPNEKHNWDFHEFVWGGDYLNNKPGISPVPGGGEADATYDGSEADAGDGCTAGTNGAKDMFKTMSDTYRRNRNITDWEGLRCYERPGYIRLGTGSNAGFLMTPVLSGLATTPQTIVVSMDLCRADKETGTYYVKAEGAGVVTNGELNEAMLPAPNGPTERKWTTLMFTVEGATNATRIRIEAAADAAGYRLNLDNIVVMTEDKVELTEPLPAPDVEKIIYVPGDNSIDFTWEPVDNATGYELSLAMEKNPDFKKTVETDETTYLFDNLDPGFYLFRIKALYAENPDFDSEEAEITVGTAGFVAAKLSAPANLSAAVGRNSSISVSWSPVGGATGYKVALRKGDAEVAGKEVSETKYVFSELDGGVSYTVGVVALYAAKPEFNSDEATVSVATSPRMTAPALQVFWKNANKAVVEWAYSDKALAESPIIGSDNKGLADKVDFVLCDAAGDPIPGRVFEDYSSFNFTKYRKLRFVYSGLEPNETYIAKMRRKSANPESYFDSEWAETTFTTDPAKDISDYRVWVDFGKHYFGGEGPLCAYGTMFNGTPADFSDLSRIEYKAPDKNYIFVPGAVTTSYLETNYRDVFVPQWDKNYLTANSQYVYLATGFVKFGKGGYGGRLVMPQLTGGVPADVTLTFDACPYYEPFGASGELGDADHKPAVCGSQYVWVRVEGAEIVQYDGQSASAGATDVRMDNNTYLNMGAGQDATTQGYYSFTSHTVKITGATSATKIYVYSGDFSTSKNNSVDGVTVDGRMWLTNIGIK